MFSEIESLLQGVVENWPDTYTESATLLIGVIALLISIWAVYTSKAANRIAKEEKDIVRSQHQQGILDKKQELYEVMLEVSEGCQNVESYDDYGKALTKLSTIKGQLPEYYSGMVCDSVERVHKCINTNCEHRFKEEHPNAI